MTLKKITVFLMLLLLVLSCKKDDKDITPESIYKFKDYVSEVTSGIISTKSQIKMVLMNPVSQWVPGVELDESVLQISPKVKGKIEVLNDRTITFIPFERLKGGTKYRLKLNLGVIQKVPKGFEFFEFDVKTIKQDIRVSTNYLKSYNSDWQYIEGTIQSSDALPSEVAENIVKATQDGKDLSIKIKSAKASGQYFEFVIDSVRRLDNDSKVKIKWDGKPFKIAVKGNYDFVVPAKKSFKLVSLNVIEDSKKYIEINFSDPLKKDQNINGLVTIKGVSSLNHYINGNILKIYPKKEIKGVRKITIHRGIESRDGYKIKESITKDISFGSYNPQVKLLQNGTILPTSEDLKFNFEAVALKAVDVTIIKIYENNVLQFLQDNELNGKENLKKVARPIAKKKINLEEHSSDLTTWKAYSIDLKEIINPNPGAIYRVLISFKKSYALAKCSDSSNDEREEEEEDYDNEETETSFWDSSYYNDDDYSWRNSDDPCNNAYYRNKTVSSNVLASNLGVTVKKGNDHSYFVAVSDIITTDPVANATVTFYNYQQQAIAASETDSDGKLNYTSKKGIYFVVVTKNQQSTYVKLKDGNVLSVSKFDVSGVKLKKGLKGFIYGERGVWRPGDTLFLSFMLNDKKNKLPQGHPVKLELSDPYGKVSYRDIKTRGVNNLYSFKVPTAEEDYTGDWMAKVKVGGASFTKSIKIETIKPNRLKIKANIDSKLITSKQSINGELKVAWLHGAIAKNLKADTHIKLTGKHTEFKAFPGFQFNDPTRTFNQEQEQVFDGKTDDEGKASFKFKPSFENEAAGMLKASLVTKVYEKGGDFSTDVFSVDYSPYTSYVGISVPKGDEAKGMLLTDVQHRFDIATVNEQGKPVAVADLEVRVYKVNQNWWWKESDSNLSSFDASSSRNRITTKRISTNSQGKGIFNFELKYPEWGRYLIYVVNKDSGHATGKSVFIDWPGWAGKARKGDPSSATMLSFSTDKKTYDVGENAIITFPSSAAGRALVTVENSSKVLKSLWVVSQKGDTKFELPITKDMTPNVFINISLLQPHNSTKNDLPIRMYGISAISVEDPETKLVPQIMMPDVLRPESKIGIKVKEKNGKPMTYSIAIVDEGLLDLTRYKTPNPWNNFFKKEALGIKTWDIYDAVIGAFGGKINQVFSIGGDEMGNSGKNKKANRFIPVVSYLGPFKLDDYDTNTHYFNMPKYIGAVRTMVVAHNPEEEAYGKAEKATPVRTPLMVLASLPRKVTQGEKLRLPVTVFALEDKIKNVKVQLNTNGVFKVLGNASQTVNFSSPDEKMAYFDVEVVKNGIGTIDVELSGHGEKASYNLEVDAINPNPVTTEVIDLVLQPNSSKTIKLNTFGVVGTNKGQLEVSSLQAINFSDRMQYLIKYPHGCVEQTTSSVFPQLFLTDVFDLNGDKKEEVKKNIQIAINKLSKFQKHTGGFSYWQGESNSNDWATSYVGHFLLEAEKKGYVLPINLKNKWISYQKKSAKNWRKNSKHTDLAQAYRLYTLALSNQPDMASMNRLRESGDLSSEAKLRLAATYALAGNQNEVATAILRSIVTLRDEDTNNYNTTYGSFNRNMAMALETYVVLKDFNKAKELGDKLAVALNDKTYMSTQTTSYSLLAMSKYAELIGGKGIKIKYDVNSTKNNTINTDKTLASRDFEIQKGSNSIRIENKEDNVVYVTVLNSGILPIGEEKVLAKNLIGDIVFKNEKGNIIDPSKIAQGTNFIAEMTVKNSTISGVKNIALSTIFPSGWEIVNTRFTDFGSFAANKVTHEDIRDDRTNFYFDLKSNETKKVRVLLNASYLGKYYLPGIQSEAMYDNNYIIRSKGRWIEVTQ